MFRLFLALRYLWSRPISWISMVGIWLTVMALIATVSVMSGLLAETEAMIRGTTTDLILSPMDLEAAPDADLVAATVRSVPGVLGVSSRVTRPGLLKLGRGDSSFLLGDRGMTDRNYVQVVGVLPETEQGVSGFQEAIRRPEAPGRVADFDRPFRVDRSQLPPEMQNESLPGVVFGARLFDAFRFRMYEVVTLVTLPRILKSGEAIRPLATRFVVLGTIQTGHPQHDARAAYIHIEDARDFGEWGRGGYSEIGVGVDPDKDLDHVADDVRHTLAAKEIGLDVSTWREANAEFLGAVENERAMMAILLFFFVAVACFNVFATVTVMVTDKTRDIGVLNAMGATSLGIRDVFVLCGVLLTLLSATLGCGTGVLVARHLNGLDDALFATTGLRIFPDHMYAFSTIPVMIDYRFVATVFVVTMLVSLLCAWWPARRAARLDPVVALRHE